MSLNEALNRSKKAEYTSELSDIDIGTRSGKRIRNSECLNNQVKPSNLKSFTHDNLIVWKNIYTCTRI